MRAFIFLMMLSCGSSTPSMPKCGADTCAGCCREDGSCEIDATQDRNCGARGSLCADCTSLNAFCNSGACTQCNPGTCGGCCQQGHCWEGTDTSTCGKNGLSCESCPYISGVNQPTCTNGICGTNP